MAAIFPPNGKPPSPAICNGFTPEHRVIGEGPLYAPSDCTSVLTDCTFNAIVSEILAAVDALGLPYNTGRVNNLATGLTDKFEEMFRRLDDKVNIRGDTMEGPLVLFRDPQTPLEAVPRRWVLEQDSNLDTALRNYIGTVAATITAAYQQMINAVDERKINRSGDTMTGPLILARNPQEAMEAATRAFVENLIAEGGVGGGGGVPEAPQDGGVYARSMGAWVQVSMDDGEYDGAGRAAPQRGRPRRDDGEY